MMNYSDYDSDGYSSNEDADYVPSDDNLSEDDINECEKEDPLHECDGVPRPNYVSKKKRKKLGIGVRKGKKEALKADEEEEEGDGVKEAQQPLKEVENSTEVEKDDDAMQKKKSDDLWASFLSDVGSKHKGCTPVSASGASRKEDSSLLKVPPLSTGTKALEPATVTITKVFDFAGEEVRVNKEVSTDSREAKSYLKSQNTKQEENEDEEQESSPSQPGPSAKRPAGMMGILSNIGVKKQKMSTLEKSKLDWDAFKSEEGITEELAIHNRGREGYVERKKFLERVDHRQFEFEKTVRLKNMKQ